MLSMFRLITKFRLAFVVVLVLSLIGAGNKLTYATDQETGAPSDQMSVVVSGDTTTTTLITSTGYTSDGQAVALPSEVEIVIEIVEEDNGDVQPVDPSPKNPIAPDPLPVSSVPGYSFNVAESKCGTVSTQAHLTSKFHIMGYIHDMESLDCGGGQGAIAMGVVSPGFNGKVWFSALVHVTISPYLYPVTLRGVPLKCGTRGGMCSWLARMTARGSDVEPWVVEMSGYGNWGYINSAFCN
jgi:hypothetical protein